MTLALNGIRATMVRRSTPWNGAWSGDVWLDLGDLTDLPTGPATLTVGDLTLVCAIDPKQSGRFGFTARARVVAGAGGWEKPVEAKHHHNDGGVLTTSVFLAAAALVGERVVETVPGRFGIDFVRQAGPAARVFDGFDWYVDANGVTNVGPRVPTPAPPSARILEWDPRTKVATIASNDVLIEPGMLLTDPRFGTAKIRDVEQTWSDSGARVIARTVASDATPPTAPGGELLAILTSIASDACKDLPRFSYRVLTQAADGRYTLAKANKDDKTPDLKLISLAPAIAGLSVKVPPGTVLHVCFLRAGKRSLPFVVGFDPGAKPTGVTIATPTMHVGATGVKQPVAMAPAVAAAFEAVVAAVNAAGPGGPAASATLEAALKTMKFPSTSLTAE